MRGAVATALVLSLTASGGACSPDPDEVGSIRQLEAPVPLPDPRWGFRRTEPNDGADVQFVRASNGDQQEAVEETHAWYEDLMYDLGWNKKGEEPASWSPANAYYSGTMFWQGDVAGRARGVMVWVSGGTGRVVLRIYCCDPADGDPGP